MHFYIFSVLFYFFKHFCVIIEQLILTDKKHFKLCFLGLLYAVGGYDGATRQCLSTVEAYNPNTNEWSYTAEMGTRRSGAGNTHTHTQNTFMYAGNVCLCKPQMFVLDRCGCVKKSPVCSRGA